MKNLIESLVSDALAALGPELTGNTAVALDIERTRDPAHGDFACNIAMRLAKPARRNPRELAQQIIAALPASPWLARAEVAGPGFINFFLTPAAWHAELLRVQEAGEQYGRVEDGAGRRALVEFVSANPTGPLHVGHGRQAAFGATLASLLEFAGYKVSREYYINDAGRQMDILAASVWLRYLELCGEALPFPVNGYRGDYLRPIASALHQQAGTTLKCSASEVTTGLPADETDGGDKEAYVDALISRMRELLGAEGYEQVFALALELMLADIRNELEEFGVHFDRWSSERELEKGGAISRALARLQAAGHLFEQDGATWFRATALGDDKDRVVVRDNGQTTYFASDIAYHLDKRERGFDLLLDILGADHHGYVARVRAGLVAMGEPGESLEVTLVQFVNLFRGEAKIPMGKREGQFVTLRQLREEVGNDASRLTYLMRSNDQPLDFDLELAKSRSNENPVYYVQYAHARVASVMRQLADRGLSYDGASGQAALGRLDDEHARALMTAITRWPETVSIAARQRAPHMVVQYLRELAATFHAYYNAQPFIVDDAELRNARLTLVLAARQVIRNALALLGVSAPETM